VRLSGGSTAIYLLPFVVTEGPLGKGNTGMGFRLGVVRPRPGGRRNAIRNKEVQAPPQPEAQPKLKINLRFELTDTGTVYGRCFDGPIGKEEEQLLLLCSYCSIWWVGGSGEYLWAPSEQTAK
jgi:hypothetical protein